MAGKKDQSVVAMISGLTKTQAADLKAQITKDKNKIAPNARGSMFSGSNDDVRKHIGGSKSTPRIAKKGD